MTPNENSTDRIIRLVVAAAAIAGALAVGGGFGVVLWIVAAIMVVTAATGFCPLYRVFGISTCPIAPNKK